MYYLIFYRYKTVTTTECCLKNCITNLTKYSNFEKSLTYFKIWLQRSRKNKADLYKRVTFLKILPVRMGAFSDREIN